MANSNTPQTGQWFYLQSALTDSIGTTYVANVDGASRSPGTKIIYWPLQPNFYNVLWQYTQEGFIMSALGDLLVLDLGEAFDWSGVRGNYVVLNPLNIELSKTQMWTFNEDGTITNQSNGLVLDVAGGVSSAGASVVVYPLVDGPPSWQTWSVASSKFFVPNWSYLQSALTDSSNNTYVASVEEGTSNVVVNPFQQNSSSQLWQITEDGRILSGASGNPVVTLGQQYNWGPNGNAIVVGASPAQTNSSLQWTYNDENIFINTSNGMALNVEGGVAGANTALITYTVQSGPSAADEIWTLSPGCPLDGILAAPPVAFPPFTGDQATAYADINQQLGITDLRSEYTNLAAPLSEWLSQILSMQCPSGVQQADWDAVVAQLTLELTAADSIQKLFANYSAYHTDVFADNGALLNKLGTDAGMEQGSNTNVGGLILSILEGVLYTALEAIPGGDAAVNIFAVLGNVMEAGINIGVSASNAGGAISPNPFQVAYSELWGQLSQNFVALLTAVGNMENTILSDWGKMQTTYADILSTGPDTLAWPSTLTAELVSNSIPGYTISVMQMLLPAKYQIYQYQANDDSAVPDVPSNAQWVQSIGNNTWNKYWIGDSTNWDAYPSDEAMNDVWNSCVAYSDFFQGLAGWGFARCYPLYGGSSIGTDCNGLVITVTNQTPNPLTVSAAPSDGQGTIIGSSSQTLQPYGSVSFVGYYADGLAIDISIVDPNLGGSPSVASFVAHQHDCYMKGGEVWVDTTTSGPGYQLTSPICNSGAFGDSYPGAVQVGICAVPISPPSN